jgi:hydroxyacylglutathione hydrolase
MIQIEKYVNSPVPSNTYFVMEGNNTIIIDPGSKDSFMYQKIINDRKLCVDYIILTHEHFDHIWSADMIRKNNNAKIICSFGCAQKISISKNYFNLLYFNDDTYLSIHDVDIVLSDQCSEINWNNHTLYFYQTPGHTDCSMCFSIDDNIFTGDTLMKGFTPFIKKKEGGSLKQLQVSINFIFNKYSDKTQVFPGHGDIFYLNDCKKFYDSFIKNTF